MCHRNDELDVSHTLTTYFLLGHFHTTTVADNALVTDTLVLSAMAFIVFHRTEDTFAEQTVAFRFISTVVNGFRFQHLAARILKDFFGRSQTDGDFSKLLFIFVSFLKAILV